MVRHVTVRMAWHDNNWNGRVCKNPEDNVYCVGNHSLLSERIARRRDLEKENPNEKIDKLGDYIPPCYWSCNAFSEQNASIRHEHPFENVEVEDIPETLNKYSVFTWPFRLSFNRGSYKRAQGKYPKDLEKRIDNFLIKFRENQSIIFFYLNFDNPVSAEEGKYVLIGCAPLKEIGNKTHFKFSDQDLKRIRSGKGMQNFPKVNWAIQLSHNSQESGILLPYKGYLDLIDLNPENQDFYQNHLNEMRILIEEPSLTPFFKYVAMDIDDDICIYLLYRLRKSLYIIEEHGYFDVHEQIERIEQLIAQAWERRGLYPSLGVVLDILTEDEEKPWVTIVERTKENIGENDDLLDFIFQLLTDESSEIPDFLGDYEEEIEEARLTLSEENEERIELAKKLCLFCLTEFQLARLLSLKNTPFKKEISRRAIIDNPYLLAENYEPEIDEDSPEITDAEIDVFKIDIGMFPHKKYLRQRNKKLQNLTPKSPERLRALIINYLYKRGEAGDCFATLDEVYDEIVNFPVFYKSSFEFDKDRLYKRDSNCYQHFEQRIKIVENDSQSFFYLNEINAAEKLVRETVENLIARPNYEVDVGNISEMARQGIEELEKKISGFDTEQFLKERKELFNNVFKKSLYILTGKPGSGKTTNLRQIIKGLRGLKEQVTVLAPTGKATLRINQELGYELARTIDMFILEKGYYDFIEDFENFVLKERGEKVRIDNLIIDEASMVDLPKLATLLSMIDITGEHAIKRIILVGDENQLPPIGFGKPFHDIIQYINSPSKPTSHFIRLLTNCRQEYDNMILKLADIFTEKNRYYEEMLEKIKQVGRISSGFEVIKWKNRKELFEKVEEKLEELIDIEKTNFIKAELISEKNAEKYKTKGQRLNLLFNLYENGYVQKGDIRNCKLDNFQILSPYRAYYYGTLGLNEIIHSKYREPHRMDIWTFNSSPFFHADKIIRISNYYVWNKNIRKKQLVLSNGSIGIINNKKGTNGNYRTYFFTDKKEPLFRIDDDENFELAYAITVHKSQGSDFKNVFLIIPNRHALLSKELIYTAFTRSTHGVTLFLQDTEENILEVSRDRSFILQRNTSVFTAPENAKARYEPSKGVYVKSKAEYIIYKALERIEGIKFLYEKELPLKNKTYKIKPDFTIEVNGKTYYWEHLGMLDMSEYANDWQRRREDFEANDKVDFLITTDDLGGIKEEILLKVITDIKRESLKTTPQSKFSKHHYQLY